MSNPDRKLTIDSLRESLWNDYQKLDKDEISPAKANAGTNISNCILRTVMVQLQYAKFTGKDPKIKLLTS